MNKQSIKVRFFFSLFGNILQIGLLFSSGVVVARTLGPASFGDLIFLVGSFAAIANLVNMSSSSAFYTFISQAKRGLKFYFYYFVWLMIQFSIPFFLVLLLPGPLKQKIWLGHSRELILLALFVSFSTEQMWKFVTQVGESLRDTISVQIRNTLLVAVYLFCVILLVAFNLTSIKTVLIVKGCVYIFFFFGFARWLYRKAGCYAEKDKDLPSIFREFKSYCSPLVFYTLIGFLYTFADYWLLQRFGGSVQQGYYAVGARVGSISMIATASILQIFWKEIAEANALGNTERVRMLYHKVSKGLYFVGAVFSCLLIPFSSEILSTLLGSSYRAAWLPLSIMLLYPVHQSLGQVTGTMLLATGRTKTKSIIGIIFMGISIITAYFVLAPKSFLVPGLNLGAKGLALKMVICQLLDVNLMAFFVAKYIKTPFNWTYQIKVLLLMLLLGFASKICAQWFLAGMALPSHPILLMTISGIFYSCAAAALLYKFPSMAGVERTQINYALALLRRQLNPILLRG
jgi:O-antigen/teichoic acid export membrane protein